MTWFTSTSIAYISSIMRTMFIPLSNINSIILNPHHIHKPIPINIPNHSMISIHISIPMIFRKLRRNHHLFSPQCTSSRQSIDYIIIFYPNQIINTIPIQIIEKPRILTKTSPSVIKGIFC